MILSVLVLLIAPYIPHHHHEGVACVVVERCEQDNAYNDEHTGHQESPNQSSEKSYCVEDATYLTAKSDRNSVISSSEAFNPALLFSILLSQFNAVFNSDTDVKTQLMYGEYIITYSSAEIASSNGLRAPPSMIA